MTPKKDTIKPIGVANELPQNPLYFTEISVSETMTIPTQKPNMEQALSIMVQAEVLSMRIVDTPCYKSFEGQLLSGKKLIMELKFKEKLLCVADIKPPPSSQPVHAAHDENTLRSVFIIVPRSVNNIPIEQLLKANKIRVTPYIEDIYATQIDNRSIFKNITMLIDVDIIC